MEHEVDKTNKTYRTRSPMRRSFPKKSDDASHDQQGTSTGSHYSHPKRDRTLETKQIEEKIDAFFEANKDSGLRKLISAAKLMEVGAHIGLTTRL
jgi:hypothetical protein